MKKILLTIFCLFTIIGCAFNSPKFNEMEKQKILSEGKAIINIEWNYHGGQLYTIWMNKNDLNKKTVPLHWFTGNNKLVSTPTANQTNLVMFASKSGVRTHIVEPGEYILWGIQNQAGRPFSKAGQGWYSFLYKLGKDGNDIQKKLDSGDYFAVFTVKAGEEITLQKIEMTYDNLNYIEPNGKNSHSETTTINVFENTGKAYKFGKRFNVNKVNE